MRTVAGKRIKNSLFLFYTWSFLLMVKVVGLINDAQDDVRPTVMVSATAVGYYGLCLNLTSTHLLSSGI